MADHITMPREGENGEATWIMPRLWQGSRPLPDSPLREHGFDLLALCAMEHQPEDKAFDVPVYRINLNDDGTPPEGWEIDNAKTLGRELAKRYATGARILVTCFAGLNRSGLITALIMHNALGISGTAARVIVQDMRPKALCNKYFAAVLDKLPMLGPGQCVPWAPEAREAFLESPHRSRIRASKLAQAPAFRA